MAREALLLLHPTLGPAEPNSQHAFDRPDVPLLHIVLMITKVSQTAHASLLTPHMRSTTKLHRATPS
jgi:hypothetical protein